MAPKCLVSEVFLSTPPLPMPPPNGIPNNIPTAIGLIVCIEVTMVGLPDTTNRVIGSPPRSTATVKSSVVTSSVASGSATAESSPISFDLFPEEPMADPPDPDQIAEADIIVLADAADGDVTLEVDDWPASESGSLLIDLTDGHPDLMKIRHLGYQVIAIEQRRIGTLCHCLRRWTGSNPSSDVIHDAIEEYLAV